MSNLEKRLMIITGASRGLGKLFKERYERMPNTDVIGINRTGSAGYKLDVLDEASTNEFIQELPIENYQNIGFIHSIGLDFWEPEGKPFIDHDGDGIDDRVYATNVTAFMNLAKPLKKLLYGTNKRLTVAQIGSLSDHIRPPVPYWQSFSKSKNIVRNWMKHTVMKNFTGVTTNTCSTLVDDEEVYVRVHADTSKWKKGEEFVDEASNFIDLIAGLEMHYSEGDFHQYNDNIREDYFTNHAKDGQLYQGWLRDSGLPEIPPNTRI